MKILKDNLVEKHPEYSEYLEDWETLRDVYRGSRRIKEESIKYLPATSGMEFDGMGVGQPGYEDYCRYKKRAQFPTFFRETVDDFTGILTRKPAVIKVPTKLEPMLKKFSANGESVYKTLDRIYVNIFHYGRYGTLLEVPNKKQISEAIPFVATYECFNIINWDVSKNEDGTEVTKMIVLDESNYERKENTFTWEYVNNYRILVNGSFGSPVGKYGVFVSKNLRIPTEADFSFPSIGGAYMKEIPFTFINSTDLISTPKSPPLLNLAELAIHTYQGDADYRQTLFMQHQETLVLIGRQVNSRGENSTETSRRVGAGAVVYLDENGDAKYVGVSGEGLSEQRLAQENNYKRAYTLGIKLVPTGKEAESGESLKIRTAASTASLVRTAYVGAAVITRNLVLAAEWMGLSKSEIEQIQVTPNLDFSDAPFVPKDLKDFMEAKKLGAPITYESIHHYLREQDVTKMTFEEEMQKLLEEKSLEMPTPGQEKSLPSSKP